MKRRSLQRCCLALLACALLLGQMPWGHAMSQGAAAAEQVVEQPCHGADEPAADATDTHGAHAGDAGSDDCCGGVQCESHCMPSAWAPAPQVQPAAALCRLSAPVLMNGLAPSLRQSALFRPPI